MSESRFLALSPLVMGLLLLSVPRLFYFVKGINPDVSAFDVGGIMVLGLAVFIFVFHRQIDAFFNFLFGLFEGKQLQEKK